MVHCIKLYEKISDLDYDRISNSWYYFVCVWNVSMEKNRGMKRSVVYVNLMGIVILGVILYVFGI